MMERFLSILISLFLLSTSQAATITIGPARGGNYDYNRIQSGIDAANNGESNRRLQVTSWRELNHSFFLTGKAIALNRNKIVDMSDLMILTQDWLEQTSWF